MPGFSATDEAEALSSTVCQLISECHRHVMVSVVQTLVRLEGQLPSRHVMVQAPSAQGAQAVPGGATNDRPVVAHWCIALQQLYFGEL